MEAVHEVGGVGGFANFAELLAVAVRLDPAVVLPDATLGDQNLIAALRPLAVDLLTAAGMSGEDAAHTVPRI